MASKKRLDHRVQELYPDLSKTKIQSFIMQGKVTIDDTKNTKPGTQVSDKAKVVLTYTEPKFVSRAGFKIEHALKEFEVDPQGLTVLDAGLSTGGFTDCLLQQGAKKVYGVDVGYCQVHEKIRQDGRVVVMERTNLRHLESLPEKVDLATLDVSFISLKKVVPAVKELLKGDGTIIALIKPQFEAERHQVGRGGIIKDTKIHEKVVKKVVADIEQLGFTCQKVIESPIYGAEGNKEFLGYFTRGEQNVIIERSSIFGKLFSSEAS